MRGLDVHENIDVSDTKLMLGLRVCFLGAPVENSFFCPPFDSEEIVKLICRQKKKSTDLMDIAVFIFKILASLIAPTVSMLFNNSLSESIFSRML